MQPYGKLESSASQARHVESQDLINVSDSGNLFPPVYDSPYIDKSLQHLSRKETMLSRRLDSLVNKGSLNREASSTLSLEREEDVPQIRIQSEPRERVFAGRLRFNF